MGGAIAYAIEGDLAGADMADLYRRAGLGERRPVDQAERMARMAANADLIVTARRDGRLVGVARAITDFAYCCYLSDLAVDRAHQRQGIGRELIRRTHDAAGPECNLVLLSAPDGMDYYPHVGLARLENAFAIQRTE